MAVYAVAAAHFLGFSPVALAGFRESISRDCVKQKDVFIYETALTFDQNRVSHGRKYALEALRATCPDKDLVGALTKAAELINPVEF